ncbi:hypothetical protein EVAR_63698_1 [Eumeta japonica]|uniref:Uncharacterized protein n=1 Tax=Eumeta variegata TaxID=151549 RepID=A0A4C1ZYF1_EUMVA|nr:hypothetical protein EVAR_63698_1 [Eumeta japonica]
MRTLQRLRSCSAGDAGPCIASSLHAAVAVSAVRTLCRAHSGPAAPVLRSDTRRSGNRIGLIVIESTVFTKSFLASLESGYFRIGHAESGGHLQTPQTLSPQSALVTSVTTVCAIAFRSSNEKPSFAHRADIDLATVEGESRWSSPWSRADSAPTRRPDAGGARHVRCPRPRDRRQFARPPELI